MSVYFQISKRSNVFCLFFSHDISHVLRVLQFKNQECNLFIFWSNTKETHTQIAGEKNQNKTKTKKNPEMMYNANLFFFWENLPF